MSDPQPTDRELVLDTLEFYYRERTKALFQLNHFRLARQQAQQYEALAFHRAQTLKDRLQSEIDRHAHLLTAQERDSLDDDAG